MKKLRQNLEKTQVKIPKKLKNFDDDDAFYLLYGRCIVFHQPQNLVVLVILFLFLLQSLRTKMSFHVVSSFWIVMTRFVISGSGQVFSGLAESTAFPIVRSGSWSRSSAGFAIYQVRPLTQFDIKNYLAKCLVWSLVP